MKRLYVLYIPGLGDENITWQARAVNLWRWFGVVPDIIQMNWSSTEPWEDKQTRLLARVDAARAKGHPVALVGASAGAAAVIAAYAARQNHIVGCVIIAGKVNRPEAIGNYYRRTAPQFVDAAYMTPASLARLSPAALARTQTRSALFDKVIPYKDSAISGAQNQRVLSIGHVVTIATQLVFGAPVFLRFLKRLAKNTGTQ